MDLVLSLFPGIGLLDSAFEQEGFCVVRGPDVLWGGDVRKFHPPAGRFEGVIGGPPCQSFSSLAHLVRANGHEPKFGNLIPEYERCVEEASPDWFLMENVPQAPIPKIPGYATTSFLLDNSALSDGNGFGLEQRRIRRFTFGQRGQVNPPNLLRWVDLAVFLLPDAVCAVTSTDGGERPSEKKCRPSALISAEVGVNGDGFQQSAAGRERARASRVPLSEAGHGGGTVEDLNARKKKQRSETINGSHGRAPSARDRGQPAGRYRLADALRLQGLPEDFLADAPFTADGKLKAVANGVPIPMGLAIARAIKQCLAEHKTIANPESAL